MGVARNSSAVVVHWQARGLCPGGRDLSRIIGEAVAMQRWIVALWLVFSLVAAACTRPPAPSEPAPVGRESPAPPTPVGPGPADPATPLSPPPGQVLTTTVYFSDTDAMYLRPTSRQVSAEHPALDAARALTAGPVPAEAGLYPTIPPGTRVLGVNIRDGVATVNFSRELQDKFVGGSAGEIMLIYSLVNTLTEFNSIRAVQLTVEGRPLTTLGHADLTQPVHRRADLIKS